MNEGKTKEAKEAKAELVDMQDRFNILMDLEEDEDEGIKDQLDKDEATRVEGKDKTPSKKDVVRAFVNRIVCGMRKTKWTKRQEDHGCNVGEDRRGRRLHSSTGHSDRHPRIKKDR